MSLEKQLGNQSSRRAVVKTGAKLAYATPILAASFHLMGQGALAQTCDCLDIVGGVYDAAPYGGGSQSCCSCEHCKYPRPQQGGQFGGVIYPGAVYNTGQHLCASTLFPNGFSASYCAPICTPCGHS
jgi:hypothetical protein